jgi:pimeloyl-ACP methyl ester carboxylesterase
MWGRSHEVDVGDATVHVREVDGPGPALLLLHGLSCTGEIWTGMMRHLNGGARVLAPDLPGHGQSGDPSDFSLETLADGMVSLTDRFGIARFHVVGSSWGAAVAVRLAARHPSRVDRVTLLDGGYSALQDQPELIWEALAAAEPPDAAYESLQIFLDFMRSDDPDLWNADIEAAVADMVREERPGGAVTPCLSKAHSLECLRTLWEYRPLSDAPALQAPVHVIAALTRKEPPAIHVFKQQQAAEFASSLRDGRVTVMPDTDHLIMLDRPAELARMLTMP